MPPSSPQHDHRSPGVPKAGEHLRRASRAGAKLQRPLLPVLPRWTRSAFPRRQWRRLRRVNGDQIAPNCTPIETDASGPTTGTTTRLLPARRRHWGMCGVAPDGGYRVGATNPTWRRQHVRGPPVRHQHHAGHDREANAGMMMCGAVCKPIFIASHQSQRSRRPVACRYAVTTLEAWTEIVCVLGAGHEFQNCDRFI